MSSLPQDYWDGIMCRIVSVQGFIATIEARKRDLDIAEVTIEAVRNSGRRRTPAKRALLRTMRERAMGQRLEPYVAYGADDIDL